MKWLEGKRIILGVTGGISAYRACDIIRNLTQERAEVNVVMTKAASEFITSLTMQTLSQNPVITELFNLISESHIGHISLAQGADLFIVAPCTANCIGKLANGVADDMLTTLYLATEAPVALAPAMNEKMWAHSAVQANVKILKSRGVTFIDPEWGELACGDVGLGRLANIDKIVETVICELFPNTLENVRVLVTAGPTVEPIDPVREVTNRSSGKMGFALARVARRLGAQVTLVSGPVALDDPWFVNTVRVRTAIEMHRAVLDHVKGMDVVLKAAAVADFRPKGVGKKKIKKEGFPEAIDMEKNVDILEKLGALNPRPYLVGFAAETDDMRKNALAKMKRKNIDAIAANDVSRSDIGFSSDQNEVNLYFAGGEEVSLPRGEKMDVAFNILNEVGKKIRKGTDG
jgi:phosphopantothenoylcysteine decarboxylase/phosphopantothenate--cysteine ligase